MDSMRACITLQVPPASIFACRRIAAYIREMESVAERLNALFAEANEPRDGAVAKVTGISQSTINRIRSGRTPDPEFSTLKTLAMHFNARPEWLATGMGPKKGQDTARLIASEEAKKLLADFEALPDAFKAYLINKKEKLLEMSQRMEPIIRQSLSSPKDPDSYRKWEEEMDRLLSRGEEAKQL